MNPASPTASVLDEFTTWPGISTQPTPGGSTAIVFEGHELGHVHADRTQPGRPRAGQGTTQAPPGRRRSAKGQGLV
jgi:Family of unknown function (DUF5519)